MNLNTLALINNSPSNQLSDEQWQQLNESIKLLDQQQSLWLSGYLAAQANYAVASNPTADTLSVAAQAPVSKSKLTILYGSQTGNGQTVAEQLYSQAQAAGLSAELYSLADFSVKQLSKKQLLTLVISTHGEGEAPDDAELFHEQLFHKKAPSLKDLQFSVLALGDSSYELFCQTGKEIDERLVELGAKRLTDRVDCDVDYEQNAENWIAQVLPLVTEQLKTENNITAFPNQVLQQQSPSYNKQNPYLAEVLAVQKITGQGSPKNTFHIELGIDPQHIQYQPGDSLGVLANNSDDLIHAVISHWQADETQVFEFKHQKATLPELLKTIELTQINKPIIKYLAERTQDEQLLLMAADHQVFTQYVQKHQFIDLLQQFDPESTIAVQDWLDQLRAVTPRLYSIASSQAVHEDEIHLTINLEDASASGFYGLASGLLCANTRPGDELAVYIEPNPNFKLPTDQTQNIIMIGPGTGVAPFRSFVQERVEVGATGKHWLLFGNPHFATDFLYQTEWQKLVKSDQLQHIDLAFSRDQSHKVYVQDKLQQQAERLWQWLEGGASLYVCGDMTHMAKDVENTLIKIIETHGKLSTEQAADYLKTLKRARRYQKDVY